MGLLNTNYAKEGKGVRKNEPKKKGFFLFFDIIWQKLTKFVGLNILYSITSILWFIFLYVIAPVNSELVYSMVSDEMAAQSMAFSLRVLFAMVISNLWGCAPVSASYAYITRCYTRGEHAWILADGIDKFKKNFKQSIALLIVDLLVIFMGTYALQFYYISYTATGHYLNFMLCCILSIGLILYTVMHYYIYQIMVTFECSFKKLIKNSLLCAIAHLPMTIVHTIISAGITIGLSFILFPGFVYILNALILLCFTRYPMEFYATRIIGKMIKANEKKSKTKITYVSEDI